MKRHFKRIAAILYKKTGYNVNVNLTALEISLIKNMKLICMYSCNTWACQFDLCGVLVSVILCICFLRYDQKKFDYFLFSIKLAKIYQFLKNLLKLCFDFVHYL